MAKHRTQLKADALPGGDTPSRFEMYPGVDYEQDEQVHAPTIPVPAPGKAPAANPDQGFLKEPKSKPSADDMILTQPLKYIVSPQDAIEKMEALNNKVLESRPELAPQVAQVEQAINQLESVSQGAAAPTTAPTAPTAPAAPQFNAGDRVTVTLEDGAYQGQIEKQNEDGTFTVRTDQSMTLQNVPATAISQAEATTMTLPASLRMRLKAARMITDAIAQAFAEGKKRRIANTSTDGQTIWLHNNAIARKAADGSVEISLAGWPTLTTRERLNGVLSALGIAKRVSQRGGNQMLDGKPWDGEWTSVGPAINMGDRPGTTPVQEPMTANKKVRAGDDAALKQACLAWPESNDELESAKAWQNAAEAFIGDGYHPDTSGEDYINLETHEPTFTKGEAKTYNTLLDRARAAFDAAGQDIYQYGLDQRKNTRASLKAAKPKKSEKAEDDGTVMACDDCGAEIDVHKGEAFLTDDGRAYCNDCFANHEGEGEDDENREPNPEMDVVIGEDDLSAYYAGKEIVSVTRDEADEDEDALYKALGAWMDTQNFWPDVWWVSDHGNSNIVTEDVFKFTKAAKGDEKAVKAMLGLDAAKSGDRVAVGDRQARVLTDPDKDGVVWVRYLNDGSEEKVHTKNLSILGPDTKVERKPSYKDTPGNPDAPVLAVKAEGEAAPAEAGAKKWWVVERRWSDGNDARTDSDVLVEAVNEEEALTKVEAAVRLDFKMPPDKEDGDEQNLTFMWFHDTNEVEEGEEGHSDENGWTESYSLFVQGPFADEAEARKNTADYHGTPWVLEAGASIGTGVGRIDMIAGKTMGKKASKKLAAKLLAKRIKAAPAATAEKPGQSTAPTAGTFGQPAKAKAGYEPTGVMIVEEGGNPRLFDPEKDDVEPAQLVMNKEGGLGLVNPDGDTSYQDQANDDLEIKYWEIIKGLAPKTPAPAPVPAAEAPATADDKAAVKASAKATALAARAKVKAKKNKVKASAFDEIEEIEIGGGYRARRKAGAEAKEGEEPEAAEIEVVDAEGKVKDTFPDAFGDDVAMIIKFLRQVLDIKEGDDKKAAKAEAKDEGKGESKGGESDIEDKPKALPAIKDEKSDKEKAEEQELAAKMELRMETIRGIAGRLLRAGHIQANIEDVDDALVADKNLNLAGAQAVAAKKAVDRKVMDLLAQPEEELLLIRASLPHLEARRVTVPASDGGLGPINISASGVIDVSRKQEVGLGAAFGRGFRR